METITLGQLLEAVGGTLLGEFQDREALIQRVDTDSRNIHEGALFIPLIGERFDGHAYICLLYTSSAKGYGGTVTVMVAFNPDDTIKQIKVTEAAETKGIGSNVTENSEYQANYSGLPATQALVLGTDVDA